jgi:hypothetical protein
MATILPFLRESVFEPNDIHAMSVALDGICTELKLRDGPARQIIAERVIDLARRGVRDSALLRDRVLKEAGLPEAKDLVDAREGKA